MDFIFRCNFLLNLKKIFLYFAYDVRLYLQHHQVPEAQAKLDWQKDIRTENMSVVCVLCNYVSIFSWQYSKHICTKESPFRAYKSERREEKRNNMNKCIQSDFIYCTRVLCSICIIIIIILGSFCAAVRTSNMHAACTTLDWVKYMYTVAIAKQRQHQSRLFTKSQKNLCQHQRRITKGRKRKCDATQEGGEKNKIISIWILNNNKNVTTFVRNAWKMCVELRRQGITFNSKLYIRIALSIRILFVWLFWHRQIILFRLECVCAVARVEMIKE